MAAGDYPAPAHRICPCAYRRPVRHGRVVSAGAGGADQRDGDAGRHGGVREGRRRADGRARALPRHRRPHLARHPVLPRVPEERRARRHDRRQQPVLVVRRRQVLQQRARRRASASRCRGRCSCRPRQHPPDTTDRVDAQPRVSRSTGTRSSSTSASRRSSSRTTAAAGRTSTGSTRPRSSSRPTTRRGDTCMTLQEEIDFERVLPLLRHRPGARPHHAVRPAAAASTSATCRTPPPIDAALLDARRRDCAHALPTRSATTSTRSSSRSRTACPTRSTS